MTLAEVNADGPNQKKNSEDILRAENFYESVGPPAVRRCPGEGSGRAGSPLGPSRPTSSTHSSNVVPPWHLLDPGSTCALRRQQHYLCQQLAMRNKIFVCSFVRSFFRSFSWSFVFCLVLEAFGAARGSTSAPRSIFVHANAARFSIQHCL